MTKAEILKRLEKVYKKRSKGSVELLNSLVKLMEDVARDINDEYPELQNYDEKGKWNYSDTGDGLFDEVFRYRIVFSVNDKEYRFDTAAGHDNDAAGMFFEANPNISYSMIKAIICLDDEDNEEEDE